MLIPTTFRSANRILECALTEEKTTYSVNDVETASLFSSHVAEILSPYLADKGLIVWEGHEKHILFSLHLISTSKWPLQDVFHMWSTGQKADL